MEKFITRGWEGYELMASGNGERYERWGSYTVIRPDPQVLWDRSAPFPQVDAQYTGDATQGFWNKPGIAEESWTISYKDAVFRVKPTPFRHLGLFPEQAVQWEWLKDQITAAGRPVRVLNLFAYTGAASIICAQAGAFVCHVDAAAGSVEWAKENARLSGLGSQSIRWIVDDVRKFMQREVRRGSKYDLILMDPPVFGRGPKGEIWRLEEGVKDLAHLSAQLLSEKSLGLLLNIYATSVYPQAVARVFEEVGKDIFPPFIIGSQHLQESLTGHFLPTGFVLKALKRS